MLPLAITKAKAELICTQPFFASILLSMPIIEDNTIPTMATNGKVIKYNTKFVDEICPDPTKSISKVVYVLCHEVMHIALLHPYRREGRDNKTWNIATDYVINDLLDKQKIGQAIDGALVNPSLVSQGDGHAVGVYNLLPKPGKGNGDDESDGEKGTDVDKGNPGDSDNGGSWDILEDGGKDASEIAQGEAETRVKLVQAANAAKAQGKLSETLARIVGESTKTRVNWKDVLRRFLQSKSKTDLSYAKPKRRFLADNIYMPSLTGEKLGEIVIAIDCSGSIDDKMLNEFTNEVKAIVEDTKPEKTHIVYFTDKVERMDTFTDDDTIVIKADYTGGTSFIPIFDHIEKESITPVAVVVLTDLYGDFGNAPEYPVLWASYGADTAPYGEVIAVKTE